MRRVIVHLLRSSLAVALLVGLLGMGSWGCIPSFRGLQPVTKAELNPKKKPKAPAEILFWKEYRGVWWGQVGMFSRMTLRRVYARYRINSQAGLKAATAKIMYFGGKLMAFRARTTCPDGRVVSVKLSDVPVLSKKTAYFPFVRVDDKRGTTVSASGAAVGCIVEFYWETDTPGTLTTRGTRFALLKPYPIHKAHIRMAYLNLKAVRPSLLNMDSLWNMIQLKRLAKMKRMKKGDGKKFKLLMDRKEREKYVRLKHNRSARHVDVWLNNLPALSRRKALFMARTVKAALLPAHHAKPPMFSMIATRTYGIEGREISLVWRNLDEAYTRGRSWYQEDRTPTQRNYQLDENEECNKSEGLAAVALKVGGKAANRAAKIKAIHEHLRQRMLVTRSMTSSGQKLSKVYLLARGTSYEINMMFIVMLRVLGIRAYPALSVPGNLIYHELPPASLFRSAVAYVPPAAEGAWRGISKERDAASQYLSGKGDGYQGGRRVKAGTIYNPANKYLPMGVIGSKYVDTNVFIIDGAGGRFFEVTDAKPTRNKTKLVWTVKVLPDGSNEATLQKSYWGNKASKERWKFHRVNPKMWEKKRVGLGGSGTCLGQSTATLVKAPNLDAKGLQEPFVYTYKVITEPCVTHGKHGFLFTPKSGLSLPKLRSPVRIHPISLGDPGVLERHLKITFPKGYKPQVVARNLSLAGPGLNTKVNISANGSTFVYKLQHQRTERLLSPKAYAKVKQHFAALSFFKNWLVLVKR